MIMVSYGCRYVISRTLVEQRFGRYGQSSTQASSWVRQVCSACIWRGNLLFLLYLRAVRSCMPALAAAAARHGQMPVLHDFSGPNSQKRLLFPVTSVILTEPTQIQGGKQEIRLPARETNVVSVCIGRSDAQQRRKGAAV